MDPADPLTSLPGRDNGWSVLTAVRVVSVLGLSLGLLVGGCDDDAEDEGGGSTGAAQTTGSPNSTASAEGTGTASTSGVAEGSSVTSAGSASAGETDVPETSSGGGSTSQGETGSDSGSGSTGGEAAFDEEFIWVADFVLANCVACHANDANGMLILPDAKLGYEEVRLALEGITANTGLLLVEPLDRNASQTYLQITNEFGAQFPVEDTDRFGAWIDSGAPYYVE